MSKVPDEEWGRAIQDLWIAFCQKSTEEEQEAITKVHPIISEIDEFGIHGPAGVGIRQYGGHSV